MYLSTLGKDIFTGHDENNTFEIRILDGYSFTQDTTSETITLNEAGDRPVRGQKTFNTALNPVELSFTSYIRPSLDGSSNHTCIERILWEAIVGKGNEGSLSTDPFKNTTSDATSFRVDFENSDVHELLLLQAFFKLDNSTYQVTDVTLDSAEVSFDIDGIAQIVFSGKGGQIIEDSDARQNVEAWVGTADGGTDYLSADDDSEFIKNKLSTLSLVDNADLIVANQTVSYTDLAGTNAQDYDGSSTYEATIQVDGGSLQPIAIVSTGTVSVNDVIQEMNNQIDGANIVLDDTGTIVITSLMHGAGGSIDIIDDGGSLKAFENLGTFVSINAATAGSGVGKEYIVPITGGTLNIENNITFLTPESLGVVNLPIGSFTGARSISGTLTAYLRTGTDGTAQLLADLIAATTTITHDFTMVLTAGGINNTPRAVFTLNHAHLVIPTVSVEDVISVEINFTGLGQDIGLTDELNISYVTS